MLETCEGKGKAVPLQAWSGPEGSIVVLYCISENKQLLVPLTA